MSDPGTATLHHLALGARDVERVASFYRDVLLLPEISRHHTEGGVLRSVWLDLGGAILMVERTTRTRARHEGVDAGLFLLAVRSRDGRAAARARVEAAGATIESATGYTDYTRDPEGNRVAVSDYELP